MPLTRKRATIWTCSDGTEHLSVYAAIDHQREIDFKSIVRREIETDPDNEALINNLWAARNDLKSVLTYGITHYRKSARPANQESDGGK